MADHSNDLIDSTAASGGGVVRGFLALLAIAAVGVAFYLSRDSGDAPNDSSAIEESLASLTRNINSDSEKRARMWAKTIVSEQLIFRLNDELRDHS